VRIELGAKEICRPADESDVKETTMKVPHAGRMAPNLSQLIQNDRATGQTGRDKRTEVSETRELTKVNIFKEARELKRIAELARKGDELRAEKVRQIKEIIVKGEYKFDSQEVAKSIIRTEVSRHLEKNEIRLMNIDLTELGSIMEVEIAVGEELRRNLEDQKKAVLALDVVALSQQMDAPDPSPASPTFFYRRIPC
jgi:flagellar biosynthesis anti-sigma factor FlgM